MTPQAITFFTSYGKAYPETPSIENIKVVLDEIWFSSNLGDVETFFNAEQKTRLADGRASSYEAILDDRIATFISLWI